jgi:hypothetical protein
MNHLFSYRTIFPSQTLGCTFQSLGVHSKVWDARFKVCIYRQTSVANY